MQSANVEASGAVGPEAMTSRASPTTSETITLTTPAGAAVRASWPPLKRDRCFLTALSSAMVAPLRSSSSRHLLHVFQSDAGHRGRRQGTGPACEQTEDKIVCRRPGGQLQQCLCGCCACRVRDRMGGLHLGDLP